MYPSQIDAAWIGRDTFGRVAIFMTAGEGPVPGSALAQFDFEPWPEERISVLPRICECSTVGTLGNMKSFEELARRGFYAYDWSDVHETRATESGMYQLMARPLAEIKVGEIGDALGIPLENLPVVADSFVGTNSLFV